RHDGSARVHPLAQGRERRGALAPGHLGARARDRGDPRRDLPDDVPRDQPRLRELVLDGLRVPDLGRPRLRVRALGRDPRAAVPPAREDALRPLGLGRAAAVFGAAIAFPFLVTPDWLVNIGVFTLMYAGLATAWNLFSGFTGYISLGQAAFFGIGAYALAITFEHVSIGGG